MLNVNQAFSAANKENEEAQRPRFKPLEPPKRVFDDDDLPADNVAESYLEKLNRIREKYSKT